MPHRIRAYKGWRYRWHTLRGHTLVRIETNFHGFPFIIQEGWKCYTCERRWYCT